MDSGDRHFWPTMSTRRRESCKEIRSPEVIEVPASLPTHAGPLLLEILPFWTWGSSLLRYHLLFLGQTYYVHSYASDVLGTCSTQNSLITIFFVKFLCTKCTLVANWQYHLSTYINNTVLFHLTHPHSMVYVLLSISK